MRLIMAMLFMRASMVCHSSVMRASIGKNVCPLFDLFRIECYVRDAILQCICSF